MAGDYALAVADEARMIYLPGKVTGNNGNKVVMECCWVKFCLFAVMLGKVVFFTLKEGEVFFN